METNEIWKEITDFPIYEVSNTGKFRVKERRAKVFNKGGIRIFPEHIINTPLNNAGYKIAQMRYNGKIRNTTIHRLVAETFIQNPNNYPEVNHKDENKLNNSVDNLEWCTHKYNVNYGTVIERITKKNRERPNEQKVIALKPIKKKKIVVNEIKFLTETDAAFHFGISVARICQLIRNPTDKYKVKIIYEIDYEEVIMTKKYAEKNNYEIVKELI